MPFQGLQPDFFLKTYIPPQPFVIIMKAQGLPLNTIVLGALAVLVLVILAAVFVPGVGGMFRTMFGMSPDAYTTCETYCTAMNNKYSTAGTAISAVGGSAYCRTTDWDGDGATVIPAGGVNAGDNENCVTGSGDGAYKNDCRITLTDGVTTSTNAIACDGDATLFG